MRTWWTWLTLWAYFPMTRISSIPSLDPYRVPRPKNEKAA